MPRRKASRSTPPGSSAGSGSSPTHSHELFVRAAVCRPSMNDEERTGQLPSRAGYALYHSQTDSQGAVTNMHLRAARAFSMLSAALLLLPAAAACGPATPAAQPTTAPTTAPPPTTAPAKPAASPAAVASPAAAASP